MLSKKVFGIFLAVLVAVSLAAYTSAQEVDRTSADFLVYGKIFTSKGNQIVKRLLPKMESKSM